MQVHSSTCSALGLTKYDSSSSSLMTYYPSDLILRLWFLSGAKVKVDLFHDW